MALLLPLAFERPPCEHFFPAYLKNTVTQASPPVRYHPRPPLYLCENKNKKNILANRGGGDAGFSRAEQYTLSSFFFVLCHRFFRGFHVFCFVFALFAVEQSLHIAANRSLW